MAKANKLILEIPLVDWNIALTNEDSMLVEANNYPDISLLQIVKNKELGSQFLSDTKNIPTYSE